MSDLEPVQFAAEIREACDSVARLLDGIDYDGFLESDLLRGAVLQELAFVEEAANALPPPVADTHSASALSR
jgi:uncharacterized protein with HEPN domain